MKTRLLARSLRACLPFGTALAMAAAVSLLAFAELKVSRRFQPDLRVELQANLAWIASRSSDDVEFDPF